MQKFYVIASEPGTPVSGDPPVCEEPPVPVRKSVPVPLKEQLRTARRQRMMHADKPRLAEQLDRVIAEIVYVMWMTRADK